MSNKTAAEKEFHDDGAAQLKARLLNDFLARDSIYAIARSLPSPVRLSVCLAVCLSVTPVDQSKTV